VDDHAAYARMAAGEADHLQRHDQADDAVRQELAEATAVGEDEVALEVEQALVGIRGLGEEAETRVDAVDGAAGLEDAADRVGGGVEAAEAEGSSWTEAPVQIARISARVTEPGRRTIISPPPLWGRGRGGGVRAAGAQRCCAALPPIRPFGATFPRKGGRVGLAPAHRPTIGKSRPCSPAQAIASS
jgi:hypothetical protein